MHSATTRSDESIMKTFIAILCTTAILFAGVAAAAPGPAPAPSRAEIPQAGPHERAEAAGYRVMSSKRHHRVVEPGLVRQSGSLSLAVGNRALRTITYLSEQNFRPGGGSSILRLTDARTRGTARFTISQDGTRSTFAIGSRKEHTLEANPDDTFTYDGRRYSSSQALATAIVDAMDVNEDSLELLASAVEISSSELRAIDKRTKEGRQKAWRVIKIIIDIISTIGSKPGK